MLRIRSTAAALLAATLAIGCGESPAAVRLVDAPSFIIVSGDAQTGRINTELPMALKVMALDPQGRRLSGQIVNFRVLSGGGRMFAGSAITNAAGIAQDYWTLGPIAGQQRVEVVAVAPGSGVKLTFAAFVATAVLPDSVTFTQAHGASGGTDLTPRLSGLDISGRNRLLVCAISSGRANAIPLSDVDNVVLDDGAGGGAQPMTRLGTYYQAPQDGVRWSTWYLTGATVGTNRRVTGTRTASPEGWTMTCASYSGVDQLTPFGAVTTASGASGAATLAIAADSVGSYPWAHLFSSNAPYTAGVGVTDRQFDLNSGTPNGALVDGDVRLGAGVGHLFGWSYAGEYGAQGAVIRAAR